MRPARDACIVALTLVVAATATAAATATRAVDTDELLALVEAPLRAALAEGALELRELQLATTPWEVPAELAPASLTATVELPVAVASLAALRVIVRLVGADGANLGERQLRIAAEADASLLVTARAVTPGMRVETNTRVVRQRLVGPIAGLLIIDRASANLSQLVMRRRLPAGTALRTADVRVGPDVNAGEAVTAVSADHRTSIAATALAAGRRGDTVAVRVFRAGRAVEARVIGPHKVELQPSTRRTKR